MNNRRKKQQIKVNNLESLQSLMQEIYNDSCTQINDVQRNITELSTSSSPETTADIALVAKEKTNALKVKDSAIKIKLEVSKLLNDVIKHNGSFEEVEAARKQDGSGPSLDDFSNLRAMFNKKDDE